MGKPKEKLNKNYVAKREISIEKLETISIIILLFESKISTKNHDLCQELSPNIIPIPE